jgi:hypothetical protein
MTTKTINQQLFVEKIIVQALVNKSFSGGGGNGKTKILTINIFWRIVGLDG